MIDDTREWPRVGELANIAGVHRVQLARQFRRYFGCSVSAYIRRSRVQLAAERIVAGGNIAAASHDAGFYDHAHLCRAFEAETSLSPSGWRSVSSDALDGNRPRARAQRVVV